MKDDTIIQKSLVDQIIDEMFLKIEGEAIFDAETLKNLKELATRGKLKKPADLTKAIKTIGE